MTVLWNILLENYEQFLIKLQNHVRTLSVWQFQSIDQCGKKEMYNILRSLDGGAQPSEYKGLSALELRNRYRKMLHAQLNEYRYGGNTPDHTAWR